MGRGRLKGSARGSCIIYSATLPWLFPVVTVGINPTTAAISHCIIIVAQICQHCIIVRHSRSSKIGLDLGTGFVIGIVWQLRQTRSPNGID